MAKDVTIDTRKPALAARVDDHIEIAVEAEDGTKLKIRASSEPLDALTGDLRRSLIRFPADRFGFPRSPSLRGGAEAIQGATCTEKARRSR